MNQTRPKIHIYGMIAGTALCGGGVAVTRRWFIVRKLRALQWLGRVGNSGVRYVGSSVQYIGVSRSTGDQQRSQNESRMQQ